MKDALSTTRNVEIDLDDSDQVTNTNVGIVDEDTLIALASAGTDVVDEDINPLDKLPAGAVTNADGSVTMPLAYPVPISSRKDGKVSTKTYSELVFHRLTGADQRAIAATSSESMSVVAFGRSTRINQAVMNVLFDKMDAYDINNAGQVMNNFLNIGPKTGR